MKNYGKLAAAYATKPLVAIYDKAEALSKINYVKVKKIIVSLAEAYTTKPLVAINDKTEALSKIDFVKEMKN